MGNRANALGQLTCARSLRSAPLRGHPIGNRLGETKRHKAMLNWPVMGSSLPILVPAKWTGRSPAHWCNPPSPRGFFPVSHQNTARVVGLGPHGKLFDGGVKRVHPELPSPTKQSVCCV